MEAIFVGTLDGVFKVLRSERGWQVTSRELLGKEVNVLAIHPERREIIYAGIRSSGLPRSVRPNHRPLPTPSTPSSP